MEKKYRITEETKEWFGHTLHRIEALRSFGCARKGDKGGWIECEENLSHEGYCWVRGEAIVCGNAKVYWNALVSDNAKVYHNALVYDNAAVYGNAQVCDNAKVFGDSEVFGNARVRGDAWVFGNADVSDYAWVYGNARVFGAAQVCDHVQVCGDAVIKDNSDFLVFRNFWSSGRYFTWTKSNNKWKVGCFYGTGKELIEKAYEDDEKIGEFYQKYVEFVETLRKC